jgi:hypothetical protein
MIEHVALVLVALYYACSKIRGNDPRDSSNTGLYYACSKIWGNDPRDSSNTGLYYACSKIRGNDPRDSSNTGIRIYGVPAESSVM